MPALTRLAMFALFLIVGPGVGTVVAQAVALRLEPSQTVIESGAVFDIDVYLDNPSQLALGGYQIAFSFDTARYDLVDFFEPDDLADGTMSDFFVFNAPVPLGVGYDDCPLWDDDLGPDVVSALGISEELPAGFTGTTGHLFRLTLLATGPAGPADSFDILFGLFEGCIYLSSVVDAGGTTIGADLQGASVTISDLPSPTGLSCTSVGSPPAIQLLWTNGDTYDLVRIYRDDVLLAELVAGAESYLDDTVVTGQSYEYGVAGVLAGGESPRTFCTVTAVPFVAPVENLSCSDLGGSVQLDWTNPMTYSGIEIQRDGVPIDTLPGDAQTYTDSAPPVAGTVLYEVIGIANGDPAAPTSCSVDFNPAPEFIRGDVDGDGNFSGIVDGVYLLNFGFTMGPPPPCEDAADANDDGALDALVDGLYVFNFAFTQGPPPPPPTPPNVGPDPTPDGLDCTP